MHTLPHAQAAHALWRGFAGVQAQRIIDLVRALQRPWHLFASMAVHLPIRGLPAGGRSQDRACRARRAGSRPRRGSRRRARGSRRRARGGGRRPSDAAAAAARAAPATRRRRLGSPPHRHGRPISLLRMRATFCSQVSSTMVRYG